ncbi:cytochrome c1 [Nitrosomonas mobilis]|uniref:Cytochrome c1 n=1 Tax=Nitrosomonas mobilis TaxID=51642 RepID=A0A1G5SF32_9PROT|nr:cytochrome c1 [Nitrosomonas mobilis]SCZ85813.1 Cytochrome c1 [Nitrosomonas mobilis]
MKIMKFFLAVSAVLLIPCFAVHSAVDVAVDKAPINIDDKESLKRGAKSFVEYCLTCHGAEFMRYNRHRDLGMSESDILGQLIHTGQKVGDLMESAMRKKEAEAWFGVAPPDLSVIARARGADWLYTYLRTFYRDSSTVSGWNNLVFDKAAMPHVLHRLQGQQILSTNNQKDEQASITEKLEVIVPGIMTESEYNDFVIDLVNYMVYLGEPHATHRRELGEMVILFLFVLLGFAYLLKKEYWRDIH